MRVSCPFSRILVSYIVCSEIALINMYTKFSYFFKMGIQIRAGSGPGRPAGRAGPGRAGPIFEEKHPGRAGPGRLFGIQLIIS